MMFLNFKSTSSKLQRLFKKNQSLVPQGCSAKTLDSAARLYHYVKENEHEKSRIHLRVDPDGSGTLIVNANRVMHLNPTAALMAHLVLEEKSEQEILTSITRHYRVKFTQARSDLSAFRLQFS